MATRPKPKLAPRVLVIDLDKFQLTLYRVSTKNPAAGYKREMRRRIAHGAKGHATPRGMYFVDAKNRRPDWRAPNSDWVAPDMRGQIIPYDNPQNPFLGGFISLWKSPGIGIHGTKFDPQLGRRVSHGCIRVDADTIAALLKRVYIGMPVFIY
jgi:L,D-transpeptidase ErfK/SrfK